MKRVLVLLALLAMAVAPAVALAHPLGNFTVNRQARVDVAGNRVYVVYVLDMAEISTLQEDRAIRRAGRAAYATQTSERIGQGLELRLGGRALPLQPVRHRLTFRPGAGGLKTLRLEAIYRSAPVGGGSSTLSLHDRNYEGRVGWREIVLDARDGATAQGASVPANSVSHDLTSYPKSFLSAPLEVASASATVAPGPDEAAAPQLPSERGAVAVTSYSGGDRFADLLLRDTSPLLLLALALGLGMIHALTPGHGKSIVAAYLVGSRGRARHALYLGATVTVSHTIGVFALGLVTLSLSAWILPEDVYPWLTLTSGVTVVVIGLLAFRVRLRKALRLGRTNGSSADATWQPGQGQHDHDHDHGHDHAHDHDHAHGHAHDHAHDHAHALVHADAHAHDQPHAHHHHDHALDHHDHALDHHDHAHDHDHDHDHGHSHVPEGEPSLRQLVAVGISGGILPCPSALVVLLSAIALHRVGLGLALIVAFSLGLATTISGIGLLVLYARGIASRIPQSGRLIGALPAVSALVITVAGLALTWRALPGVV